MPQAIILSDLHLGSDNCQARALGEFLETLADAVVLPEQLILNGDVFDSIDFRRLKKTHWKVLSLIRKLSDRMEIVWIVGNHDGDPEFVSHLLGVTLKDEYAFKSGDRKILVLHGHRFDRFLDRHPHITRWADRAYWLLQRIDWTHCCARTAKRWSKTFLRCTDKVRADAVAYARKHGYDVVCCGHTHRPLVDESAWPHYYNSGCWTERPCHYLTVDAGEVRLRSFVEPVEVESERDIPVPELVTS